MNLFKLILFIFLVASGQALGQVPFSKGINLTQWFQTSGPRQIQFTKFTKQDFLNIKSLGCDVIRLPINLHFMTNGAPDYKVDPLFYTFLDEAINWAEELEIYLMLDNHTFDPAQDTDPAIGSILVKVWGQLAERYKDRSEFIIYEILNEPHGIGDATWGQIQGSVIDAIRAMDTKHTIVVGGAGWNSFHNLRLMPEYDDDNLIYTFHFYDPFVFTHQGATWTDPSMGTLAGVPFPYDGLRMPTVPENLRGSWIEDRMNSYGSDGNAAHVKQQLDIAIKFRDDRQVPIFCGEFGAYIPNAANADRVRYYQVVRSYLEDNDIPWTSWDYQGGFGLFEQGSSALFESDLNLPLLEALGFETPEQTELVITPDTEGFYLFDDFFGDKIISTSSTGDGSIDLYNQDNVYDGDFCIKWANGDQYANVGFEFRPRRDLSQLANQGYYLDFWVRGTTPGTSFVLRFVDTKEDDIDHPWRIGVPIEDTGIRWNGNWRRIRVPLTDMREMGSWDNGTFYTEVGEFDWTHVSEFEIVAEQQDLNDTELWFDNIRITNEVVTGLDESQISELNFRVFPNPATGKEIAIQYNLESSGSVKLSVYDLTGNRAATLVDDRIAAGSHTFNWRARDVASGLYLVVLTTRQGTVTQKLIVDSE